MSSLFKLSWNSLWCETDSILRLANTIEMYVSWLSKQLIEITQSVVVLCAGITVPTFSNVDIIDVAARNYAVCHPLAWAQSPFKRTRVQGPISRERCVPRWSHNTACQVSASHNHMHISFYRLETALDAYRFHVTWFLVLSHYVLFVIQKMFTKLRTVHG